MKNLILFVSLFFLGINGFSQGLVSGSVRPNSIRNNGGAINWNGLSGTNWGTLQANKFIPAFKFITSTNYTCLVTDTVIQGNGTNQIVTLLNGTNGVTAGSLFTFLLTSTNAFQSMIVTNANGVQTILTSTALAQTITNGQSLTVLWDGSNWR